MKITRNQRKEEKKNKKTKRREDKRKTTFEPAAPVGGTSIISIVMFYLESAWCLATLSAFCFLISSTAVCPPPHSARSVNNRHAPSAIFPAPWRCALSNVLFPPPPYRQASHLLLQACHSCLFRQPLLRLDIQRR